jgi:hypothetical protein
LKLIGATKSFLYWRLVKKGTESVKLKNVHCLEAVARERLVKT